MKKLTSIFLVIVLMLLPISNFITFAANTPQIAIETVSAERGNEVDVKISLVNNTGVASLKLNVSFDNDVKLKSVVYNTELGGQSILPQKLDPSQTDPVVPISSPVVLNWVNGTANTEGDMVFATLTFVVNENAAFGKHNITITYDEDDVYRLVQGSEENIAFDVKNGGVIVYDANAPQISVDSVTSTCGSEVDVKISLINNTGVSSLKLNVSFDSGIKLKNVVYNMALGGQSLLPQKLDPSQTDPIVPISSPVVLNWFNGLDNTVGDMVFATLTFVVDENASFGVHNITVDYDEDDVFYLSGGTEENIAFSVINGGIDVLNIHTVTFKNWDGSVLKTETVAHGSAATAPSVPKRTHYLFSGWDKTFDSVTTNLEVTATFSLNHTYVDTVGENYLKSEANCISPAVYYKSCSVCGEKCEETFTFGSVNKSNHVGGTHLVNAKEATCAEAGYTGDTVCDSCGDVLVAGQTINKLAHTYGEWVDDQNGTSHTHTCTVCGTASETENHEWNDGIVTTQPTCAVKGEKTYTCTKCGATKKEDVDPTGQHTYGEWVDDQNGTSHTHTCTVCSTASETENHKWNDGVVTKQPTCSAEGEKTFTCTVCGATKKESVDPTGIHTYIEKVDAKYLKSDANCTSAAIYYKSCSVCEVAGTETFTHGEKNANNHIGGTHIENAKPATITEPGYTGDTVCNSCQTVLIQGSVVYTTIPFIKADDKTTVAGKTIEIPIILHNNPGFAGMALYLSNIPEGFTLTEVRNGVQSLTLTTGAQLLWDGAADYTEDGLLATLVFSVSGDVEAGEYEIKLNFYEAFNFEGDDVEFETVSSTVKVIDFVYGDANGDGAINTKDIILLRRHVAGKDPITGISSVDVEAGADANGDGVVNTKDIILLRRYVAGKDPITGISTVVLGPTV